MLLNPVFAYGNLQFYGLSNDSEAIGYMHEFYIEKEKK